MAAGETSITDIAARVAEPTNKIAVYLQRLETYYGLIERKTPLLLRQKSETRYFIRDIFLQFWFRYIYRRQSYIERGNALFLWKLISQDLTNYQGRIFEKLCIELFLNRKVQDKLLLNFEIWEYGNFWSKKDSIEIDLIAFDKKRENLCLIECKINPKRITAAFLNEFQRKADYHLFKNFKKKRLIIWTVHRADTSIHLLCKHHGIEYLSLEDVVYTTP